MKALMMPMGYNVGEIRVDGQEVGVARNAAAAEAIKRGFKYLMFIDSDTLVPANGLRLLTYHLDNNPDYDIAAGLYTNKGNPPVPLIWDRWGEGVFWDWTLGDVLKNNIVACGTGCMLIRVSLFERLEHSDDNPWFLTDIGTTCDDGGQQFQYLISDDIHFCRRAVQEAGAKILVDTTVYCSHIDSDGVQWQLRDDSLPVKRLAEKLGESADAA
jgi:cellulose synthase/poly-beta-1,6-N-acetylglucosamine synthase-like glycosyltransferase